MEILPLAASAPRMFLLLLLFSVVQVSQAAKAGAPASGTGSHIMILQSAARSSYKEVTNSAVQSLESLCERKVDLCADIRIRSLSEDGQDSDLVEDLISHPPRLIVTLGVKAANWITRRQQKSPVLFAFLPETAYRALKIREHNPSGNSAIFLNHLLENQLRLISYALPDTGTIGVLFGPASADLRKPLETALAGSGFSLVSDEVAESKDIGPALENVLESADVFLALPDPLIHNQQTIFTLLLTSYRRRVPVIGFSESYVKAGALLSLYVSTEQIGRQIAETLWRLLGSGGKRLPTEQHPSYFSVAVNPSVARSLGINLPDARQLEKRLAGDRKK